MMYPESPFEEGGRGKADMNGRSPESGKPGHSLGGRTQKPRCVKTDTARLGYLSQLPTSGSYKRINQKCLLEGELRWQGKSLTPECPVSEDPG